MPVSGGFKISQIGEPTPRWGCQSKVGQIFPENENERNWTQRGGRASLALPLLDSPMASRYYMVVDMLKRSIHLQRAVVLASFSGCKRHAMYLRKRPPYLRRNRARR